jgi:phage regulator Rha-like protein
MEERLEQIKRMQGFNIFHNKTCSKQKHDNPWNPMEEKSSRCRLEPEKEQFNTSKHAKDKGEHEWIILHERKEES